MIVKLNQITPMYFVMLDEQGVEKTGVSSVSVYAARAGASPITLTQGSDFTWSEVSSSNMPGLYLLTPQNTKLSSTAGDCVVYVRATGCIPAKRGYLVGPDVWDHKIDGSHASGTAGEIMRIMRLVNTGRMRINSATKRLEVYAEDASTIEFEFDLKDLSGAPTDIGATERMPR